MSKRESLDRLKHAVPGFRRYIAVATLLTVVLPGAATAQQFTTDNYLAMPHGTETVVLTTGSEMTTINPSFAVFRDWEFFVAAYLYRENADELVPAHFTSSVWFKYMFHENEARNAGVAVTAGTGRSPGYYRPQIGLDRGSKSWWITPMVTVPFLDGNLLWDLNPGAVLDTDYEGSGDEKFGFQYATRLALYGVIPKTAVVGEVFGTEGDAYVEGQYRVGIRWEPSATIGALALTWSRGFEGSVSGGLELGVMIFSPRFLCFGGCDP